MPQASCHVLSRAVICCHVLTVTAVNITRREALNVERVRESLIRGSKYLLLYLGFRYTAYRTFVDK
jgi:hypothetical protein